jgi:hypothetical protein
MNMKKKLFGITLLITCLFAGISNVRAQVAAEIESIFHLSSIDPSPQIWAKRGYIQYPFDVFSSNIMPNFKGHSTTQIYASLYNSGTPTKGKFETTEEFQERLRRANSKPLFGKVRKSSPLAFSVSPSQIDYNADSEEMKVYFYFWENPEGGLSIMSENGKTITKQYVAQNGFGAKTVVTETSRISFGFSVVNYEKFWFSDTDISKRHALTFQFRVPRSSAPKFENSAKGLFIGYISAPEHEMRGSGRESATFDSPYASVTILNYVCIRLKLSLLYNSKTGYVYARSLPKQQEANVNN